MTVFLVVGRPVTFGHKCLRDLVETPAGWPFPEATLTGLAR